MARIIVTTEHQCGGHVLLDEHVCSEHLVAKHSATQLIERLLWAVRDAEDAQRARARA